MAYSLKAVNTGLQNYEVSSFFQQIQRKQSSASETGGDVSNGELAKTWDFIPARDVSYSFQTMWLGYGSTISFQHKPPLAP